MTEIFICDACGMEKHIDPSVAWGHSRTGWLKIYRDTGDSQQAPDLCSWGCAASYAHEMEDKESG